MFGQRRNGFFGTGADPTPYTLPIASATVLGGVKIGSGVSVAADGTISVSMSGYVPYTGATTNVDLGNNTIKSSMYLKGTLTYSAANVLSSFQSSVATFNQFILQNSNNGNAASSDLIVSNDVTTETTFYGDLGINSSTFAGSGSFNLPNSVYLTATSGDLVLGTTTNNIIRFVVNSSTTDAMQINASNNVIFNGSVGIGQASPAASALLDIVSTTKGILIPRMTTTQVNAISSPATGLRVYDSTLNVNKFYNASAWDTFGSLAATQTWAGVNTFSSTSVTSQALGHFMSNGSALLQLGSVSNVNQYFAIRRNDTPSGKFTFYLGGGNTEGDTGAQYFSVSLTSGEFKSFNGSGAGFYNTWFIGNSERMRISTNNAGGNGGYNLLINTTTDDITNKLQVNGSIKSTQYRLSALNTPPASSTDAGVLGELRYDANYTYLCTVGGSAGSATWKRSAFNSY